MAFTLAEVVAETKVNEREIVTWVEQRWVLPAEEEGRWIFDQADLSRVALISELRGDLAVNEEAVPLVLRLLDQLYSLRQAIQEVHDAVEDLPEQHRTALQSQLRSALDRHGSNPREE